MLRWFGGSAKALDPSAANPKSEIRLGNRAPVAETADYQFQTFTSAEIADVCVAEYAVSVSIAAIRCFVRIRKCRFYDEQPCESSQVAKESQGVLKIRSRDRCEFDS